MKATDSSTRTERKMRRTPVLMNGLRFPEVRELIVSMRRGAQYYTEIEHAIRQRWPVDAEKWVSKSAIQRFWSNAKLGNLKEFGIDVTAPAEIAESEQIKLSVAVVKLLENVPVGQAISILEYSKDLLMDCCTLDPKNPRYLMKIKEFEEFVRASGQSGPELHQ